MIVRSMRKLKNLNYSQMSTLSAFIKIAEAEQKLQLKFSKEFKEYLLIFGVAKGNGHVFTGLSSYDRLYNYILHYIFSCCSRKCLR